MKRYFLPLLVLVSLTLSACSSNDSDDERPSTREVAGTYSFSRITFDPDAVDLRTYNLLDTLVAADTKLYLFERGTFLLTYRYQNGNLVPLDGSYVVSATSIRLARTSASTDAFMNLIIPAQLLLNRSGNTLTADLTNRDVDMGLFSRGLQGVQARGTLQIVLTRQ